MAPYPHKPLESVSDPNSDTVTPYRIVGTAGHIDHGKSALVQALTGTDPDRLQEEKKRGITIDLGFADSRFGGFHVGFVDVPGHERFVKNMLAGVGGIDAVILVVAADESVMPQTREHLAICELLGIRGGVVALTKCDLVDAEIAELAELEVSELLDGTSLQEARIVRTSATTGKGLDELREALAEVFRGQPARTTAAAMRLPIDRVFTIRGFGTVVTGTLLAGEIHTGDRLEVLPGDLTVTVRGLQVHGAPAERATAGQRVALNLHGVQTAELSRGMVLARPGELEAAHILDVRLDMLPGFAMKHLQRVRFHHGAAELLARVALLTGEDVPPGESAYCQLRLEARYPAVPGDRAVLRRYSPLVTIAGAEVLDVHPHKRRRGRAAIEAIRQLDGVGDIERLHQWVVAAGDHGLDELRLARRSGRNAATFAGSLESLLATGEIAVLPGTPRHLVARRVLDRVAADVLDALGAYHDANPLRPGMEKESLRGAAAAGLPEAILASVLEELDDSGQLVATGSHIALAGHRVDVSGNTAKVRDQLLDAFDRGGLAPPRVDEILDTSDEPELARELFHLALREGHLTRITDQYVVTQRAIDDLVGELRTRIDAGAGFTISDFKAWTGLSRKHSIPLLEHLDTARVTRRAGNGRVLN